MIRLSDVLEILGQMPDDFMSEGRGDNPPEDRDSAGMQKNAIEKPEL